MKIRIQIVMEAANGESERIEEIVELERSSLQPETLGLTLAESKTLLQGYSSAWLANKWLNIWHNLTPVPTAAHVEQKKDSIPLCTVPYLVS